MKTILLFLALACSALALDNTAPLPASGVTLGSYGGSNSPSIFSVPTFTVERFGRLTLAGSVSITNAAPLASNGNTVIFGALTALTAATPTSGTITVTGAAVGDSVIVTPSVFGSSFTHVDGVVTSANTVTLYAQPLVAVVTAMTNSSVNLKVFAQ